MSDLVNLKIRRDLSRWSRKLLLTIGLETIGRELVGEENWRHLYPASSDWEQDKGSPVSDFDPGRDFLTSQLLLPSHQSPSPDLTQLDPSASPEPEEEDEEEEQTKGTYNNLAQLLPYWYLVNRAFGNTSSGTNGSARDLNEPDRTQLSWAEALDAQQINALFLLHSLKQTSEYQNEAEYDGAEHSRNYTDPLLQEFRDPYEITNSLLNRTSGSQSLSYNRRPRLSISPSDEEPLDLTQKSKIKSLRNESPVLSVLTEVSSSNGKDSGITEPKATVKSSPRGGRGYTSLELEAALRDIQSGKLGTRRAAVIYGIPRSTLRNKVYKLGKDRARPYFTDSSLGAESSRPAIPLARNLQHNSLKVNDLDSAFRLSQTSAFSPVSKSSVTQLPSPGADDDERKSEEEISHEKKVLKEWLLARQRLNNLQASNVNVHPHQEAVSDESEGSDGPTQDLRREYANSKTHHADMLRKKLKRRLYIDEDREPRQVSTPVSTLTSPTETLTHSHWKRQQEDNNGSNDDEESTKRQRVTNQNSRQDCFDDQSIASGNTSDVDGSGKKSRPKRGKYRNYDRDALIKAVKAVQNGEMSVHRAGSYFGVPHSTLEYKVKERHLLRLPKRKGSEGSKLNQKSTPESSLSGSELSSSTPRPEFPLANSSTREMLSRFIDDPRRTTNSPGIMLQSIASTTN